MTAPTAASGAPPQGGRSIVVLLVDDQPFVAAAVGRLLAAAPDIDLHCCQDATAAVAAANQLEPSLILQDLVMPGIDGLTLVRSYRSNPTTTNTPVIVLSANDDAADRAQAIAGGATDYLVKLPTKDDLIACIRRHAAPEHAQPRDLQPPAAAASEADREVTLDPSVIAKFLSDADAADFARTLIDRFLQEAGTHVETLKDAVQRADPQPLKATAHSLKGSSMMVGAKRLGGLCSQLETHMKTDVGGALAPALVTAIDEELAHVRAAFVSAREAGAGAASSQTPPGRTSQGSAQ